MPREQVIMEKYGKIEDMDRSFDIKYWQSRPAAERMAAAWELVEQAWEMKGRDVSELQMNKTIERYGRLEEHNR